MRFETSIDIDAPPGRVWNVLTDLDAWPQRIETVDSVELLTPAPLAMGSRARLRQPKLPEGIWEVTAWDPPNAFEWTQKGGGVTSVAGHRVEALDEGRARLTLTLDLRGLLIPIFGRLYRDLTNRYMALEAAGLKRASEADDAALGAGTPQ
jgi:carbon monoxide dehydrogenase subunit G